MQHLQGIGTIRIRDADGLEKRGGIIQLGAGMTLNEDADGRPVIDGDGAGNSSIWQLHGTGDPNGVQAGTFGDVYRQDDAGTTRHPFWVLRNALPQDDWWSALPVVLRAGDSLIDTEGMALDSHTSSPGPHSAGVAATSWTKHPSYTSEPDILLSNAGDRPGATISSTSVIYNHPCFYLNSHVPAAADQQVEVTVNTYESLRELGDAGYGFAVLARYDATADTGYVVYIWGQDGYDLVKRVAGVETRLLSGGFNFLFDPTTGEVRVGIRTYGSRISVMLGGYEFDWTTNTAITAVGRVGFGTIVQAVTPSPSPSFTGPGVQRATDFTVSDVTLDTTHGWRPHFGFGGGATLGINGPGYTSGFEMAEADFTSGTSEEAVSIGLGVSANRQTIAIGAWIPGNSEAAIALGVFTELYGDFGCAVGNDAIADGTGLAAGVSTIAGNSCAIGTSHSGYGERAIALGVAHANTDTGSLTIGYGTNSLGSTTASISGETISISTSHYTTLLFGNNDATGGQALHPVTFRLARGSTGISNQDGADWRFITNRGRGTGTRGKLRFYTGQVQASGSTLHSLTERLTIQENGVVFTGTVLVNGSPVVSNSGGIVSGTTLALAKFATSTTCSTASGTDDSGPRLTKPLRVPNGSAANTSWSIGAATAGMRYASNQVFVAGGGTNQTVASFYSGSVFGLALTTVETTAASLLLTSGSSSQWCTLTHKDTPGTGLVFVNGGGTVADNDSLLFVPANGTRGAVTGGNQGGSLLWVRALATTTGSFNSNIMTIQQVPSANNSVNRIKFGTIAGAPTGAAVDGCIALDSTNNKLWVRLNGTWKYYQLL